MSLLPVGIAGGGYEIAKSLRFRSSAPAYLSRTPAGAGNRRAWTWSGWVKRGGLSVQQFLFHSGTNLTNDTAAYFQTNTGRVDFYTRDSSVLRGYVSTTATFFDPSAHYHFVFAYDANNATADERMRIYCNGNRLAVTVNNTLPQNTDSILNSVVAHRIGAVTDGSAALDGYLSEINFVDGQALTPASFGETDANGVWQPKKYTGTYGTNGFYLPFNDGTSTTNLGLDRSGNGNNWTPTNISLTAGVTYDWMDDTPSNNFLVLSPLDVTYGINPRQPTNANLRCLSNVSTFANYIGTIRLLSGKYYFEFTAVNTGQGGGGGGSSAGVVVGIGNAPATHTTQTLGNAVDGTVFGYALDLDGMVLQRYKDGTLTDTISSLPSGAAWVQASAGNGFSLDLNFGQRPFAFSPPSGFLPICTKSMPGARIANPRQHFDVVTRVGFGSSGGSVSSLQFKPDLLWNKTRNSINSHGLYDSVRGVANRLRSDQALPEDSVPTFLTGFASDGYTIGAGDFPGTTSLVEWLWRANGAAVTNTSGTISSQVNANTQAGFSIVTYTGNGVSATVGHGLGVTPNLYITKSRGGSVGWTVYHKDIGNNVLFLSSTSGVTANSQYFASVPNLYVIAPSTGSEVNANGTNYVAYCFAEVAGFSRISTYTGNGNADGPFVWCGFRPRWVMIKRSDASASWVIYDTARSALNTADKALYPNLTDAEFSPANNLDILSNGFKLRNTSGESNGSGGTYVFMAFAESPFQSARAR